ncbi:hypothetical protein ABPG77_005395 [Micractinium sp. CCAP 211/92]
MKDTLRASADRLRLQAIVATTFCMLAASTLPGVEYYYVFQHAGLVLGPFAWAHWIVVGIACGLGVLAHSLSHRALLAFHVAACCMLGAALGGFDTAFWYQLATRCTTSQLAFLGCSQCSCAGSSTCTAQDFASDPTCHGCTAYPREACAPALQQSNKFLLAFTGLTALAFLAIPVFYSLLVLCRLEGSHAAAAAKRQMVAFAVDQQTALVEAGEKPSVTPPMLASWVGFLLDSGEPDCTAVGDNCRNALAGRGFDLPIARKKPAAAGRKLKRKPTGVRRRNKPGEVAAEPRPDEYAVAEFGGAKPEQTAGEEQRKVQFMVARA